MRYWPRFPQALSPVFDQLQAAGRCKYCAELLAYGHCFDMNTHRAAAVAHLRSLDDFLVGDPAGLADLRHDVAHGIVVVHSLASRTRTPGFTGQGPGQLTVDSCSAIPVRMEEPARQWTNRSIALLL